MKGNHSVINYHDLKVDVEQHPEGELLEYLKSNVLGTPGGVRYKHTQTEEKLKNLGEVYFLLLRKSGRMLGSIGLCNRETLFSDKKFTSWYVRYFAIKAPMKSGKPKPGKQMEQSARGLSMLRMTAAPYFHKPGEKLKNLPEGTEKSLIYAYIEKENFQSLQFAIQNDFVTVRKFSTYIFSRFFPRKNKNVFKLQELEKDEVKGNLMYFYRDHTLYMDQNLFYRDNYLVYKEKGAIVAGMQANPDGWEIKDMGGKFGKFLVHVVSNIPLINRVFNPAKLKFVSGDYIFWKPGFEHVLQDLFETACKMNKTSILMTWSDTGSKLINTIDKQVDQGYIGRAIKRVEADVKVRFIGYEPGESEIFYSNPTFISAFDTT
jgi:hypothetical protein